MRHQKARQNEIKRWTCASPQKKKIEHMKAHIYKKKEKKKKKKKMLAMSQYIESLSNKGAT
jgi:hypothetical protein